jgi:hypothetical protein
MTTAFWMEMTYFFFALFMVNLKLLWSGSNTMKCSDDIISNGRGALRNRLGEELGIFLERSTICGTGIWSIGTIWVGMN